nr:hypothetical protein [Tanacetum cinerariifolium]
SQKGQRRDRGKCTAKVLRKDHATFRPAQGTLEGESTIPVGLDTGSTVFMTATQDVPTSIFRESGRRDPDWKCCDHRGPEPIFHGESGFREIVLLSLHGQVARGYLTAEVGRNQQLLPGYPIGMPRHGRPLSTAEDFWELRHLPNAEFLSHYNKNIAWQVAMGSQLRLRFEQEVRLLKKATPKIARRDRKIQAR